MYLMFHLFGRLRVGWNFIKLSIACLDSVNVEIHCSSKSSWREIEIGNYLEVCNQLFPPEILSHTWMSSRKILLKLSHMLQV